MNRAYGILGLVLLVLVGLGVLSRLNARGDDRAMIQETLNQSLDAARKGQPSAVLDALSRSLTVNSQDAASSFGQIANFIKSQKPDLAVTNPNPIVAGDEATITSPVQIKASLPIVGEQSVTVPDVVLTFKKETAREFLVFPVPKWRLVQVQAPESALGAMGAP